MEKKLNDGQKEITLIEKKISPILDLIENCKQNSGSSGFNLSKKIIQDTDFDLFINYLNHFSLDTNTSSKAIELIDSLIALLDYNIRSKSLALTDFCSVKITCLFIKLNIFFNNTTKENSDRLLEIVILIKEEIENMEAFNITHLGSQAYESTENNSSNLNSLLNQIPLLKSYLIHWSLLIFDNNSSDLANIENYLDLVLT